MKGRAVRYSDEELAWIESFRTMKRRHLHWMFVHVWERPDVTQEHIVALCTRRGWLTGRTGRFAKGHAVKPKTYAAAHHPNCRRTQFKRGNRPHTTKHLGHERTDREGYVLVSVAETNPHTGFERRYVFKHRHLWVQANGPVPEGHVLKCLDGDRANSDPSNWAAVPRAMLPRLNGRSGRNYDRAPAELKPTIMAIARLEHVAQEAAR